MQEPAILLASFRSSLDAETRQNAWGPNERALWIVDHLDEYLARWLGFAAMSIDPRALIQSDFFTLVEIASDALVEECPRFDGVSERHLGDMREALEALRAHGNADHALKLKELAADVRAALAAR